MGSPLDLVGGGDVVFNEGCSCAFPPTGIAVPSVKCLRCL